MVIIFLIVAAIFFIAFLCCLGSEKSFSSILGIAFTFGCICYMITFTSKPSAMDVYQGKTELKKTYINNLCVDSCVIFKDIN